MPSISYSFYDANKLVVVVVVVSVFRVVFVVVIFIVIVFVVVFVVIAVCAVAVVVSTIRCIVCIFVFRIIFFHDDTLSFFFAQKTQSVTLHSILSFGLLVTRDSIYIKNRFIHLCCTQYFPNKVL